MLAIFLAWRGHKITFGYLPKLQSPIKEPIIDHPSAKPYLKAVFKNIEKLSDGKIKCVDLSDISVNEYFIDEKMLYDQVLSDTIMCIRCETVDRNDPEIEKIWNYYQTQARYAHALARTYLSQNTKEFDLVLVGNGTTFETAHFCQAARELNIPVNTFEKFDFRCKRVINHGDHFLAFEDINDVWKQREKLGYNAEIFRSFAVKRAKDLLNERKRGATDNWGWSLQKSPDQALKEGLDEAGVGDGRKFVLLCTNVPYDAGYSFLLGLFPSMKDWLISTVQYLLENTDIHVVVRAHPGEADGLRAKERSEHILAEYIGHERLTVIPGSQSTNTYNLIEACHFGIVFASTTGVEMAILGKVAVVGSTVYYGRRGFTVDSDSIEAFLQNVKRLADIDVIPRIDEEQCREAAVFHFIFYLVMLWPYPYHKPTEIRDQAIPRLITTDSIKTYIPFFDAISLSKEEWGLRIGEFLTPNGKNHVPVPEAIMNNKGLT
ncbi:hypothetical protein BEN30_12310 [Magnetovibrio blakemorei]|uniref:Capsule polysaccharide biosynthesis protein n=2 Tax=Magnetovibrio blakemorei TaxID=28181 RepID=A0A1E5Q6F9_9PROT|nr:hypothetical protein BEN30_12310 [Magnetovibrio blakemorei]